MSDTLLHIEARDLRKTYRLEGVAIEVLRGVTVDVRRGETLAITGQSGAGKSTLLHLLGGLDQPTSGTVRFAGEDLFAMSTRSRTLLRGARIGYVFQSFQLLPELDIADNVVLPALAQASAARHGDALRARALELLERVGLAERARHKPLELSGGEQQRVALARALMNDPEIVLADEPTGNLDSRTGQRVLDYLFDLTKTRGHTLVLVTHNEAVADLCQRRLHLKDGQLA